VQEEGVEENGDLITLSDKQLFKRLEALVAEISRRKLH
jgi:hypothetical protein